MTIKNKRILDEIRKKRCQGRVVATIPRDSRSSLPKREAVLQLRHASYSIKRQHILNPVKGLQDSIALQVIYVKEESPPRGKSPTEWFLAATEPVNSPEGA
jgi:Mrp family chromosome partitioning ATPase